ncbi:MAG: PfkB family carbohydrate kinase [Leifsonia sp.]
MRLRVTPSPPGLRVPVVAAVGDNTIDRYVGAEDVAYVGGNALNVAAQLAASGVDVGYFGAIGEDAHARTIARGLHRAGIDPSGLVTLPGATAVTTIRVTDAGERVFESEDFGVTADYVPSADAVAAIAASRWVHIGMLPRASELRHRLRALAERDGRSPIISQDCAVADGFTDLDVAFGSVGEHGDAEEWCRGALAGGARLAVVTRGASGALAGDGDRRWEQRAVPASVIDTTGAGDAFIAGFIASRLAGSDVTTALRAGAELAAGACSHRGGWSGARVTTPPSGLRQDGRF